MQVVFRMPCVVKCLRLVPRRQAAPCSTSHSRGSRAAAAAPRRLHKPVGSKPTTSGDAVGTESSSPSPPSSSDSHVPFIHPELMEGPLEYLPSGWANQTPPSTSTSTSHTATAHNPSHHSAAERQQGKGQWVGQWTRQEPSRSSMWDRQNSSSSSSSSSSWGASSSSSSQPPRDALAPRDQQLLQTSLRNHLFRALSDQPAVNLLEAGPHTLQRLTRVFGLVFRQPGHDQEGFYSLHAHAGGAQSLGWEIIMVFELQEEAERYACLLEAAMEPHHPRVFSISASLMVRFCREHGYQCRLEPAGSLTTPPERSVALTDWERVKNLRNDSFLVLDTEPNPASADQSSRTSPW